MHGVAKVAVPLTHEQALVDYNPETVVREQILGTLRDIGYVPHDPRKLRTFKEEEAALVRDGTELLGSVTALLAAIGLIATVTGVFSALVPAMLIVLMMPLSHALLHS